MHQETLNLHLSNWELRSGKQNTIVLSNLNNSQYQQLTSHLQMSNKSSEGSDPSEKTVSSTGLQPSSAKKSSQTPSSRSSIKKRIGPYSYHFTDVIGTGYSSTVYKGIKNDNKSVNYAIKVINLISISSAKRKLLDNEISILRSIDHPNLLRMLDLFYTENNCYIITEYCEGGSLQKLIDKGDQMDWRKIVWQVGEGVKYLARNCIVHRDIKPANVFLKEDTWKIGDFGFAITLSQPGAVLIQNYTIGSPLFMPLETLESNVYSAKTDSFALGVLIYHLMTRNYPWYCKNKAGLIKSYKSSKMNQAKLKGYGKQVIDLVRKLLRRNVDKRGCVVDLDFGVFLGDSTKKIQIQYKIDISAVEKKLLTLTSISKVSLQVTLCQYIHYLMQNLHLFLSQEHPLFLLLANHLYHLTTLFGWESKSFFNGLRANYFLPLSEITIDSVEYRYFLQAMQSSIKQLLNNKSNQSQVGLQKILQYYLVLDQLIQQYEEDNGQRLSQLISELLLHTQFNNLLGNPDKIQLLTERAEQKGLILPGLP